MEKVQKAERGSIFLHLLIATVQKALPWRSAICTVALSSAKRWPWGWAGDHQLGMPSGFIARMPSDFMNKYFPQLCAVSYGPGCAESCGSSGTFRLQDSMAESLELYSYSCFSD